MAFSMIHEAASICEEFPKLCCQVAGLSGSLGWKRQHQQLPRIHGVELEAQVLWGAEWLG
jgi:hypothetical protein